MTDAGNRIPDPPHYELVLPAVKDVRVDAWKAEARRLRNFKSALPENTDTFAFVVTTDQPIPVRALGPTLYVGKSAITEVTEIAPNTYRFVAHEPRDLVRGSPIYLGWSGQLPVQKMSRFRFDP